MLPEKNIFFYNFVLLLALVGEAEIMGFLKSKHKIPFIFMGITQWYYLNFIRKTQLKLNGKQKLFVAGEYICGMQNGYFKLKSSVKHIWCVEIENKKKTVQRVLAGGSYCLFSNLYVNSIKFWKENRACHRFIRSTFLIFWPQKKAVKLNHFKKKFTARGIIHLGDFVFNFILHYRSN